MTKLNHSFLFPVITENEDQCEGKKVSLNAKTWNPTPSKQWHRGFRGKDNTGFHEDGVTRSHGGKREYLHHIADLLEDSKRGVGEAERLQIFFSIEERQEGYYIVCKQVSGNF